MRCTLTAAVLSLVLCGCGSSPAPQNTAATPPPATGPTEVVPATVDTVGTQGRDYGGGIITEPISAYFKTKDKINLQALEYGQKLYQASNGEFPPTLEEAVANAGIKLPPLPPGHEYVYEAKTGQLFVKRPAAAPAANVQP